MAKMNVFISQPMGGRRIEEVKWEREQFVMELQEDYLGFDINILDTISNFDPDEAPLVCLGRALEILAQADLAIFMPGWENARGCRIEHEAAKNYLIPTLELNGAWYLPT